MLEGLEQLFKLVNKLMDEGEKSEQKELQLFVKEIYDLTEEIYNNFSETLHNAYNLLSADKMSISEAVIYFNDSRLPFKSARSKVRGVMKHPYYHRNPNLAWFAIGVVGVLEGGLKHHIEMFFKRNVQKKVNFNDVEVSLNGRHTLVDIIRRYDKNNYSSLFYAEAYENYSDDAKKEKALKERLLGDIDIQIQKIDEYWQMVCDHYPQILMPE